jgi:hypothetical protein
LVRSTQTRIAGAPPRRVPRGSPRRPRSPAGDRGRG